MACSIQSVVERPEVQFCPAVIVRLDNADGLYGHRRQQGEKGVGAHGGYPEIECLFGEGHNNFCAFVSTLNIVCCQVFVLSDSIVP